MITEHFLKFEFTIYNNHTIFYSTIAEYSWISIVCGYFQRHLAYHLEYEFHNLRTNALETLSTTVTATLWSVSASLPHADPCWNVDKCFKFNWEISRHLNILKQFCGIDRWHANEKRRHAHVKVTWYWYTASFLQLMGMWFEPIDTGSPLVPALCSGLLIREQNTEI